MAGRGHAGARHKRTNRDHGDKPMTPSSRLRNGAAKGDRGRARVAGVRGAADLFKPHCTEGGVVLGEFHAGLEFHCRKPTILRTTERAIHKERGQPAALVAVTLVEVVPPPVPPVPPPPVPPVPLVPGNP